MWVLPFVAMKPEKGARSPLFAATADIVREKKELYGGKYLEEKCQIAKPHKAAEARNCGQRKPMRQRMLVVAHTAASQASMRTTRPTGARARHIPHYSVRRHSSQIELTEATGTAEDTK